MAFENTILVIGKTRLELLIERFNTKVQAKFYIEHAGGNFSEYELEHETFQRSMDKVVEMISHFSKHKVIDRKFLPNFIFSNKDLVVALGQDGLVANTAKYVNGQPILGVNPDPLRNDGILLPYTSDTLMKGLTEVFEERFKCRHVTMAQAKRQTDNRCSHSTIFSSDQLLTLLHVIRLHTEQKARFKAQAGSSCLPVPDRRDG